MFSNGVFVVEKTVGAEPIYDTSDYAGPMQNVDAKNICSCSTMSSANEFLLLTVSCFGKALLVTPYWFKKQNALQLSSIHKSKSSQCSTKTPPTGARWGGFFQDIDTGNHRKPANIIWDTLHGTNIFHLRKKILQLICESKRLQQCLGRGYVSSQEGMPPYDRVSTKMAAHMFLLLLHFVTGGRNTPKTSAFDCYVEIFVSVVQYVLSRWNHLFPPSFSQFSFTSVSKLCKINSKTATNFPISPPAHLFLLYPQAATKTTSTSTNDQNMVEVFKRGWNPQQMLGNPPINFTILWGIGPVGCKPLFHVMPLPFVFHVPKFPKSSWRP